MPPLIKKILQYLGWGFLLYAVITSPDRAADIVEAVAGFIWQGLVNIGRFFQNLAQGL